MTTALRILIAEDDEELRDRLVRLLDARADLNVIAAVSNGADAVRVACQELPHVALLDVRMPILDGIGAASRLHELEPGVVIILYTAYATPGLLEQALAAGARGYLTKDLPPELVAVNLFAALSGTQVISPALDVPSPFQPHSLNDDNHAFATVVDSLPEYLQEVLSEVARAKSNREIARKLHLSEGTARNYVARLLKELHCSSRTELAIRAVRSGFPHGSPRA